MNMKRLIVRMSLSVLFSAALFVSLTGGIAFARGLLHLRPYYSCTANACDGKQPSSFGCQNDPNLYVVSGGKYEVTQGNGAALIELMYSPQCGTNWVRMASPGEGLGPIANASIWTQRKSTTNCTAASYQWFTPETNFPLPFDGVMVFAPSCPARAGFLFPNNTDFTWTPYF